MKILMLLKFPLHGSGSGTYARKLAEKLAQSYPQDEVAILCPDQKNEIKGVKKYYFNLPFNVAFTGHPDYKQCKIYSKLSSDEITRVYEAAFKSAMTAYKDFQPDVIHVHHASYFTWIANYIQTIYGTYYVVTVHGTGVLAASEDKRWVVLTRFGLERAHMINCVSNDTKKWMLKVFGRRMLRQTRIVTGGVDLDLYRRDEPIRIINRKYHLKDKKVVIFVGKLTSKKGVEYLVKAAPRIRGEIFIIGGGEEKPRLEKLSKSLKCKNVHFLGYFGNDYIKELREFYRRADVFVFPSVWDEPLGLVALEAMASSTPVVASKKGGIPLAVKDGINGFLVRAKSAKQIAEKVNLLLKNDELRKKMGEEARKTVEEKFNWTKIAQRFHGYYEDAHRASQERLKRLRVPVEEIERERLEIKGKKLDYI